MAVGLLLLSVLMSLKQALGTLPWTLGLPNSILGLQGSCVLVPCVFTVPEHLTPDLLNCSNAIWKAQPEEGSFIFSPYLAYSQVEVVGDVRSSNCTSVFSGLSGDNRQVFLFRLQCSRALTFTYRTAARISLQTAPPQPQLDAVHPYVEGEMVSLQCSVPVPCPHLPPTLTWVPQDEVIRQQTHIQQSEEGLLTLTSTLTFIASANHNNRSLTCSASYPLLSGATSPPSASSRLLRVLYPPRSTGVVLLRLGSDGRTALLVCLSDANPPVSSYSWFRLSSDGQLIREGSGELLEVSVPGEYLCEAKNQIGSQRSGPSPLQGGGRAGGGGGGGSAAVTYILSGVLFLLYVAWAAVVVVKFRRLSRRLKRVEAEKDHVYTNLRRDVAVSDYDQIQPKAAGVPDYVVPI